jgi:hypothetical protein
LFVDCMSFFSKSSVIRWISCLRSWQNASISELILRIFTAKKIAQQQRW